MLPLLLPLALQFLPGIARALGGDTAGEVAKQAAGIVASVTGTSDPVEAEQRLAADPKLAADLRIKLAEIEAAAAKAERDAHLAEIQAVLGDVQNARGQTVALAQAGSAVQWAPVIVSFVVLVAFAGMGWAILSKAVPADNKEAALLMLGNLSSFAGVAVAYWLGSSAGSARKDMRNMLGGGKS